MKTTLLFLLAMTTCFTSLRAAEDRVAEVDASDEAMNAAIAAARKTLPHFWQKLSKPEPNEVDFHLKVRIEDDNGIEHFWCSDVRRKGKRFTGVINNDPMVVKNVRLGERVTFSEDQISDWLYLRGEKMIGNYTARALLPTMTKAERTEVEAMLGPLP